MTEPFGALTAVNARDYWPNEAHNFTPWLAEHINELADAVGLELEVEKIEVAIGPYAADIVAREPSGQYVIIENQLGKTDHDHLGKLLTYASALNAIALIWVATEFTEQHLKALEWLNENTSTDVSFFAVRLELWRIDQSRPAVRFDVVSQPIEPARKVVAASAAGTISEAGKLQLEFWTQFRERLLERKVVPAAGTAAPRYLFHVPLGRTGIFLLTLLTPMRAASGCGCIFGAGIQPEPSSSLSRVGRQLRRRLGLR